jgi:hypothetical protein
MLDWAHGANNRGEVRICGTSLDPGVEAGEGAIPTSDPRELFGDFWPEVENTDDFLAALREWRGRTETDQTA